MTSLATREKTPAHPPISEHLAGRIQREFMYLGLDAEPCSRANIEPGLTTVLMPRKQFLAMAHDIEIDQTAIYFLLGMATARFGVDLLRAPIEEIRERVRLDATTG